MSMLLMVQAMKVEVGNAARKLVLLKLADNANDDGRCWPSYDTIAKHCEMSKRTVMRHIQQLEEDGFLTITHRKKEGSNENKSNIYTLKLASDRMTPLNNDLGSDRMTPRGDTGSLGVVTQDHQGSDPMSPRTSHRTSHIEPVNINNAPSNVLEAEVAVFEIPTNKRGEFYGVTQSQLNDYQETYPATSVLHEFRKMLAWCDANPKRRKTMKGIKRFINSWLSNAQDKPQPITRHHPQDCFEDDSTDWANGNWGL